MRYIRDSPEAKFPLPFFLHLTLGDLGLGLWTGHWPQACQLNSQFNKGHNLYLLNASLAPIISRTKATTNQLATEGFLSYIKGCTQLVFTSFNSTNSRKGPRMPSPRSTKVSG